VACSDFVEDWVNTDLQAWAQEDKLCPQNTYDAPVWFSETRKLHMGFQQSYRSAREIVRTHLQEIMDASSTLYITGHSLGGALATLAGYDLTCNKVHDVLPKIITIAAPSVFKDSNRFKHIVKETHYLRVVSEGKYKDIITTAAMVLAYNQPSYTYLRINPNYRDGLDQNCMLGLCHPIVNGYVNQKVAEAPAFHKKCNSLVGNPPAVTSPCVNNTDNVCSWPNLLFVADTVVKTTFQMVLTGQSPTSFTPAKQQQFLTLVSNVVGVDLNSMLLSVQGGKPVPASDIAAAAVAANVSKAPEPTPHKLKEKDQIGGKGRKLASGLVVDISLMTPEVKTAELRTTISNPAFAQVSAPPTTIACTHSSHALSRTHPPPSLSPTPRNSPLKWPMGWA
jgi:hypothetical protein